jgi:hypothetical protein
MRTPHAYTHITFFERSLACEKLLTCCNPAPTAMLLLPANKKENRTFVAIGLLSRKRPGLKKKGRLTQRGVIEEISRYLGILYEFRVHVSCFLAPASRICVHQNLARSFALLLPLLIPLQHAPRQCASGSLLEP